jgi:chorismate mutase / prephenate dehydratase
MTDGVVSEARETIDAIDRELLLVFNRRLEVVRALHRHKAAAGMPLRDLGREEAMVAELQQANGGPLSDEGVRALVAAVLELTRRELHGE